MLKFLLGIVSYMTFMPIVENLTELVCSYIEVLKGKNNLKIVKINNELQNSESYDEGNLIGFQYNPEPESEEEYDEE